ncbi:MAG: hypothetical protein HY864_05015 [Chloroflexi bacterium]|nr:hypothetical protein [Chloroflexota bacterium]
MNTRQANIAATCITLLFGLSACSAPIEQVPTQTVIFPTSTPTATFTFGVTPATLTPDPASISTPFTCAGENGLVEKKIVETTKPPQEFLIYLPPCYESSADLRFPVLYLLHGQTYTDDQWIRLGVPQIADHLIQAGEIIPFIIVFPDDRYWNLEAGSGFGDRLINAVIPFVDENYRTLADRDYRSLGGLSRGGGWAIELGFAHPELFGALGLHSPAIKVKDGPHIERIIKALPEKDHPLLWLDIGDVDPELASVIPFEEKLTGNDYVHEFHLYPGGHTEDYWGDHAEEYLRWYAQRWMEETTGQ